MFKIYFDKTNSFAFIGCQNDHVWNIINFELSKPVLGWSVNCVDNVSKKEVKKCDNWYCPSSSKKTSSIKTKLIGTGRARLNFGNCHKSKKGKVKVLLDGKEITKANKMQLYKNIEFDFIHESTLEIVGEKRGVAQFNSFEVLTCNSGIGK